MEKWYPQRHHSLQGRNLVEGGTLNRKPSHKPHFLGIVTRSTAQSIVSTMRAGTGQSRDIGVELLHENCHVIGHAYHRAYEQRR
jgi:hypothetical protein